MTDDEDIARKRIGWYFTVDVKLVPQNWGKD
jgi:hypothetical protein